MSGFRKIGEELLYEGPVFRLMDVLFESPTGERFQRQLIRHSGAVAVVAITHDEQVVLVRQFRGSVESHLLELPAGLLDVPGESLALAAARELREETGLAADSMEELTTFLAAPGMADERVTLFLATGLTEVGTELQGPEEQHLAIVRLPFAEALEMSRSGLIIDAKTIIGLHLVAAR